VRNIRIGKDFNVIWSVFKIEDGGRFPYNLEGKDLRLVISTPLRREDARGWKVEGNRIKWTFRGRDQRQLGRYQLVLLENEGFDGMVTVDTGDAFCLVASSRQEKGADDKDIVIEDVRLESDIALAPNYDDTEIRKRLSELEDGLKTLGRTIPTRTSELANDSGFVSSGELKTINGESILGEGDLVIEGGSGGFTWIDV